MSILSDKINSFSIENQIQFNEAYQLVPTQEGPNQSTLTSYWTKVGRNPVFENNVGPVNGAGSWRFDIDPLNYCRHRVNGGALLTRINDYDWSTGIWVKINSIATGINIDFPIFTINTNSTAGMEFGIRAIENNPSKIIVMTNGNAYQEVATLQLDTWYLLSARRYNNVLTYYINGTIVHIESRTSPDLPSSMSWGNTLNYTNSINVANFYMASADTISGEQITEIYLTGMNLTPQSVSFTADPFEVTANMTPGNQKLIVEIQKSIGLLHKKINSYDIENGTEFNESYQQVPTQTGTVTDTNSAAWSIVGGGTPTFQPEIGPNNGFGSWNSTFKNGIGSRVRTTSSSIVSRMNDYDISTGIWIKVNEATNLPVNAGFILYGITPVTTLGFLIGLLKTSEDAIPTFAFDAGAGVVDLGQVDSYWHYFAVRRVGSTGATGIYEIYKDGQLITTQQVSSQTSNATGVIWGISGSSSFNQVSIDMNMSNSYIATSSVIGADEIAEIWDIGNSQALTKLPSNVNTEITSYDLLRGIRFNENYADPYTQTGSVDVTTAAKFTLDGGNIPTYDTPPTSTSEGGWTFNQPSRVRDSGKIIDYFEGDNVGQTGVNFSMGFWIKVNSWSPDFNNKSMIRTEGNQMDFALQNKYENGKRLLRFVWSGQTIEIGSDLNLQEDEWYYIAVRRITFTGYIYLNGLLVHTFTNLATSSTADFTYLTFGSIETFPGPSFTISNFYLARNEIIADDQIDNIWEARNIVNFEQLQTPLTADADMLGQPQKGPTAFANALMVQPVITSTIGDHTEIVTSFPLSAEFLEPTILTGEYVIIENVQLGTMTALMVYPFNIETNLDRIIAVVPFEASALINEAKVAERPMTAITSFPEPALIIDENYYQMVMKHQPLFYVEDGAVGYNLDYPYNPPEDPTNPLNHGSMDIVSYDFDQNIRPFQINHRLGWKTVDATGELQTLGNQKAWEVDCLSDDGDVLTLAWPTIEITPDISTTNLLQNAYDNKSLTIEMWIKPTPVGSSGLLYKETGNFYNDGITLIGEGFDFGYDATYFRRGICEGIFDDRKPVLYGHHQYIGNSQAPVSSWKDYVKYDSNMNHGEWNHLVVSYEPVEDPNKIRQIVYLNTAIVGNQVFDYGYVNQTPDNVYGHSYYIGQISDTVGDVIAIGSRVNFWGMPTGFNNIALEHETKLDEIVIYPKTLTYAEIVEHYNFVTTRNPDVLFGGTYSFPIEAVMGDHQTLTTINFEYEEDPMTALAAQIPQPTFFTGYDASFTATVMSAQAFILEPAHSHDAVIAQAEFVAYAESANAFHLNTIYYDYVQANIAPYRYVTFDSSEPYLDYGSDIDYSVANFVINGTVVNPDFGINGKSVKSTGSYTNGALVIKESEHDDNWGTGANSWHSSFWMQRALDDNSTGLRVLWNLNGAYDDQNIILYHYNNKLHLQINNQVAAPITISTPNNVNPFDFGLHHFVINSHHNNNKNHLYLYMDGLLIADQDIGTYQVDVINDPIHVGANDEANNFPRLGIGTLITSFDNTALPVVPTGISVYFDEIYWDKNQILAAEVAALFSALPGKITALIFGNTAIASAESIMPALTTTANYLADPALANAESGDHTVFAVFNNTTAANTMLADALMTETIRRDDITFVAGVMGASASIGGAGTPRVVNGQTMQVTSELANRRVLTGGITVNGIKTFEPASAWVKFVKINNKSALIPMDGVK